jgi:hypothetical protein
MTRSFWMLKRKRQLPELTHIPRSRSIIKVMLPGLKIGDVVQTTKIDFSQVRGGFETRVLPNGSVGRVKRIFDFGPKSAPNGRFLVDVKFHGHPVVNFYSTELKRVRV